MLGHDHDDTIGDRDIAGLFVLDRREMQPPAAELYLDADV